MKKNKLSLLILIAIVSIIIGCRQEKYTKKDQLEKVGVLGVHELRRIEQTEGISGNIRGSFFLGCGSVSGGLSSERQLQFYWGRNKNEIISTTLPYSAFQFLIDSARTVPTVEFVYSKAYLDDGMGIEWKEEINTYLNYNPNSWLKLDLLKDGNFQQAVVKISRGDLEKEVYLQK